MRASLRLASAFFALIFIASAVFAEDYAIKLTRPDKPGFKYEVARTATLKTARSLKEGETLLKSSSSVMTIDFASERTVLEVNDRGGDTKCSYKIARCTVTTGNAAGELLSVGTEVIASVEDGKKVFRVNDAVVSPRVSEVLNEVVSLSRAQATDDDVFGTAERKKIGETWPINSTLAAADLSKEGPPVKPEDITGTVKLVGLAKIGEIPCLEVSADVSLKTTNPPPSMPAFEGFTFSVGSMKASYSGKLPIDPSLRDSDESADMAITMVFLGDLPASGGPRQTMEMTRSRGMVGKSEPLN